MNPVYEKLALRIAQLELDKALLQVELERVSNELAQQTAETNE